MKEQQFAETLSLIHEAAFDPAAWDSVLRRLAAMTGCVAGGLTREDPLTGRGMPITYFGFDSRHVEKTFDHYLPMNPLFDIGPKMVPGFIVSNGDVVPLPTFKRSEFYNGWARPQGLCSPITLVTHRSEKHYVPLTLVKPDGSDEASRDDRVIVGRFAPHLLQAVGVSLRLNAAQARQDKLLQTLERFADGVILLDERCRIIFANTAADELLGHSTDRPLLVDQGKLSARDLASDTSLQAALSAAVSARGSPKASSVQIRQEGFVRPLILNLAPLPPATAWEAAGDCDGAGLPRCMILIDDNGLLALSRTYRLTPAETRLVEALMTGKGLTLAARALGIMRSTGQTQLDKVFQKTGTSRQAELLALIHSKRRQLHV